MLEATIVGVAPTDKLKQTLVDLLVNGLFSVHYNSSLLYSLVYTQEANIYGYQLRKICLKLMLITVWWSCQL